MEDQQEIATPVADGDKLATEENIAPEENSAPEQDKTTEEKKPERKKRSVTHIIVYIAVLTAISIVMKLYSNLISGFIPFSFLKVNLHSMVWMLSAILLGPWGGIVALISDLLAQLILPHSGTINPIITAGNALSIAAFGAIFRYLPVKYTVVRGIVAVVACTLIGTLGLNTLGIYVTYYMNTNYFVFLGTRCLQVPMTIVNFAIAMSLIPLCRKIKLM